MRYYDPTSGRVLYGDENIRDYTPESWRNRIAIVPQDPALFSATIAENSTFIPPLPSRATHAPSQSLTVDRMPRARRSRRRPAWPTAASSTLFLAATIPRSDRVELSFQEVNANDSQSRVHCYRSLGSSWLTSESPVQFWGEGPANELRRATSALDAASESLVNKAIANITASHSLTTILIAHRLSTLKTADVVVMMEHGLVAEQGTYEELKREGTRFNHLVRSQMLSSAPHLEEVERSGEGRVEG